MSLSTSGAPFTATMYSVVDAGSQWTLVPEELLFLHDLIQSPVSYTHLTLPTILRV